MDFIKKSVKSLPGGTVTNKLRRAYLDTIRERYKNAPKRDKKIILNEFCSVCRYSRKYAIRILNGRVQPRIRKSGPKPKYGSEARRQLVILWEAMNRICSKKIVVALPLWLPFYKDTDAATKESLQKMSASTIDRILKPYRREKGRSTTRGSLIKSSIPIKLLDSEVTEPGFLENDTVAHCGDSMTGSFANTLTMTDLYSGWTENRAIWTKAAIGVIYQVERVEKSLPFRLKGFASDNGTEFLNEGLESYLKNRPFPVEFVRRRPYRKNDSAHVEQKNWTHVRELFGYKRFEDPQLVPLMNEIYQAYWNPLWNYFTPTMKLKSKTRVGSKIVKKYDEPMTPMQRLLLSPHVISMEKRRLKEVFATKNPFHLKLELDKKLKQFFAVVEKQKYQLTGS